MTEIIRAKGIMDGSTTLAGAAAKLRVFADDLDYMHGEGYRLDGEITDDYGHVLEPDEKPDAEYGATGPAEPK